MNINIKSIMATGERVTLECKKAQNSIPNSLWDTYSAFANTSGGIILLGVIEHIEEKDITKRFDIVGVEDVDKIRKDLWNIANSREKVSINLLHDEDVETITIDDKNIIKPLDRARYPELRYSILTINHHCLFHWHHEASSLFLALYNGSHLHDYV